ncbi:helix-turn-helix transcriptional regulator [Acetobacter oeni]|uniref:AraC family transcriptional regulator n=1 Tax=Acetobacter oeni TaxID=304077 RepID=A0A511XR67_9PROT|nr:helix-turn-helix transcriptional regulator [Acetobacter oeni]MBB3885029.1 AraC-like DNA-binding protein [Acetobacter oeni]NHO20883.1 helix-turn-helix domain-containing protein [Acetobacter oeni]GBR06502.1 AraC family transcriptional regulator [Acetobacter oeni LMG 21952]GEN65414.1 AraC family transcriptional regulator [Acetobacter oeni]
MKNLTARETQSVLVENRLNGPGKPGFAFLNPSSAVFYDWHAHPCHQITYARRGTTQIEGPDGHHLLPTAHAIWIPAETRHRTMIRDLDGVSVYFDPACFPSDGADYIQTFPVTAMVREMLFHTLRWQAGSAKQTPIAQSFFQTLGLLCVEQMQAKTERLFTLPRAAHPSLVRAMDAALASPGQASLTLALHHAGMSERSFRRHFHEETGMTWQDWIAQARLFHAATLLAEGQRVTDVAARIGYASLSAFAKAFTNLMGMSPVRFRNAQTNC